MKKAGFFGDVTSGANEFVRDALIFFPILGFFVIFNGIQMAFADFVPIPQGLCGPGMPFPCPAGSTGQEIAKSLVGQLVNNIRYIIGAVAIIIIIVEGVKLVTAQGNEEVLRKAQQTLLWAIVGLFVVGLAGEVANIFEVGRGGFLKDPNVAIQKSRLFNRTVQIVITFIKYTIGSVAVLFIVRSGVRLVTMGDNEEEVGKDKKNILYGMLGLVMILISGPVINDVFFKIDTTKYPGLDPVRPGIDAKRLGQEIAGVTNIIAAITGPFAILSLVAGGIMYAIAGGDEEKTGKAKKIIMWSAIGIVIIYGAFAIVSTFIRGQYAT